MKFTELTKENLPEPNRLVWIKRNRGHIYLGYRIDKPLSTNEDSSRDCHWYGNPSHNMLWCENYELHFNCNFSDVTVKEWADLDLPNANIHSEVAYQTDLLSQAKCTDCKYWKLCPIYREWKEEHEYFQKDIEDFSCKHFEKESNN